MFFEDDDEGLMNPDLFHVVRHELFNVGSTLKLAAYGLRNVPTHTEDGIPIRKLYVSNLPPKTTRSELFGVFAPFGFIKNCWLRMSEKGPNRTPYATYAFVTFSNPEDAHKALQAPNQEKMLRGRFLRISPADSWHQPPDDANRRSSRKPHNVSLVHIIESPQNSHEQNERVSPIPELPEKVTPVEDATNSESKTDDNAESQDDVEITEDQSYSILDILNRDCLMHILSYVPIRDIIMSESVSKQWQSMIQEYLSGIRTFKTSWWTHARVTLTTAVLRRVLMRVGSSLLKLHIDHQLSALNDRTAHTLGKFCPNLEELKVVSMHTKNWNPLIYGCKNLKNISFISCNKLTDSSLVHLVKSDLAIESLSVANNTHVTGLFLTGSCLAKLNSLSFYNCYSLQGTVLSAAIETLPNLTILKIDDCPPTMWTILPLILNKLPKLVELSLSEYSQVDSCFTLKHKSYKDAFCKALATLTELKSLNLSINNNITDAVLKQIAQSCHKLETLNVSCCNHKPNRSHLAVSDEGVIAVCSGCVALQRLDVSYLGALTDEGVHAAAALPHLTSLKVRGNPTVTAAPFVHCLLSCRYLEEVDVCGCDNVSEELVAGAIRAVEAYPRHVVLRMASTCAANTPTDELPVHKLVNVNVTEDRSILQLRPDFVDNVFENSSDDSLEELYDHDEFNDYFGQDDELFLDDDFDDYEGIYALGFEAPDIILI